MAKSEDDRYTEALKFFEMLQQKLASGQNITEAESKKLARLITLEKSDLQANRASGDGIKEYL